MISAKDLMEEIMDGEEYITAIMPKQIYNQIQTDLAEQMAISVRVKSCKYKEDPQHCEILKEYLKAKKKLINREFEINNGK